MSNLSVDKEEMENALAAMHTAINQFRDIERNAFGVEADMLEVMQSYFVERLAIMLECVRECDMEVLLENLDTFHGDARTILTDLVNTDEAHNVRRVEGIYG